MKPRCFAKISCVHQAARTIERIVDALAETGVRQADNAPEVVAIPVTKRLKLLPPPL